MSSGLFAIPEVPLALPPGDLAQPAWSPRLRLAVIKPWGPNIANYNGDVHSLERDSNLAWHFHARYTSDGELGPRGERFSTPHPEIAYHDPCWIHATNGLWYGIVRRSGQVKFFGTRTNSLDVEVASSPVQCIGAPGLIQSSFGNRGNFELVIPTEPNGMAHLWANNNDGLPEYSRHPIWNLHRTFGSNRVLGVRLIQSDWGNLEVIALEQANSGLKLVHYFQNGRGGEWLQAQELDGSDLVNGIPGFIQSSFGTENGGHGNFEVVAPARSGGLLCWWRQDMPPWNWNSYGYNVGDATQVLKTVHLVQQYSVQIAGRPIIHQPFIAVGETPSATGIGFGSLIEYTKAPLPPFNWTQRTIEPIGRWPGP
jgi:hypothetical protein